MVLTWLLKKLTCICHIKSACEFSLGLSFLEYSQRAHSCLPTTQGWNGWAPALRQRTQAVLGTSCRDQYPLMAPPFSSFFLHKSLPDGMSHCVQLLFFCFLWLVMSIQITQMPGHGRWWVSRPEKVPLSLLHLFISTWKRRQSDALQKCSLQKCKG